ncbi:hypothetical protein C7M84_011176 [Penaeus vannamei]|uniref:CUB domain-containing protein n=1 Tax=Penaeus vannamei TaxID=6689 RepID=A0A3R7Q7L0_PENVA|nr:hypothetical protein C7M84_011176 [Penaeus vannamei]
MSWEKLLRSLVTSKSKGKCIATDAILGKDSVVVYTTNQKKRSKCKITIRGKKGVKLTMQCSRFSLASSGCDAEVLQVVDKGSKETTKFCQNDNPGDTFTVSTGNQIQLKYKKKKFRKKDGDSSLGFVYSTQADLLLGNEADCGKAFDVQVGQSAVVASTASRGTCSISLNGKSGSVLSLDCPHLQFGRKCRAEDLFVQDRIDLSLSPPVIGGICYWLVGYPLAFGEGNAFCGASYWASSGLPEDRLPTGSSTSSSPPPPPPSSPEPWRRVRSFEQKTASFESPEPDFTTFPYALLSFLFSASRNPPYVLSCFLFSASLLPFISP